MEGSGGENLIPNSVGFLTKSNSLLFVSYSLRFSFCYRLMVESHCLLIGPALRSFPSCSFHLKAHNGISSLANIFSTHPVSLISSATSQRKFVFKELVWLDEVNLSIWYLLILHFKIILCISQAFYHHIFLILKEKTKSCFGIELVLHCTLFKRLWCESFLRSLLNLLKHCSCFMFFFLFVCLFCFFGVVFSCEACGILAP